MARQDVHSVRKGGNEERTQDNFIELYATVTSNTAAIAAASASAANAASAAAAAMAVAVAASAAAASASAAITALVIPVVAAQSDQETGTSTTKYVAPGRQQYHSSAAKGWVDADSAGNAAAGYNVTSVTDNGTGDLTITWAVAFSAATYCAVATARTDVSLIAHVTDTTSSASVTRIQVRASNTAGLTDPNNTYCAIYGDQ